MLKPFCENYTHSHNSQPIEIERTLILYFYFCFAKNIFFMSKCNKRLYSGGKNECQREYVAVYYYYYAS